MLDYEKRRCDAVVTVPIYQEIVGRAVSRFEALKLAHQIIINAEQERVVVANFEATRGIQWEKDE